MTLGEIGEIVEEDRAYQKVVDALNKIGCTSFVLSEEEIKEVIKVNDDEKIIT